MFDPRDLAWAIKKLRGNRYQNALAKSVGVNPGTWCKWEQGGTTPTQVSFPRIARALGCTVERLWEVIWECRQERLGGAARAQTSFQTDPPPAHPAPLVRETDRMLRRIDRQLASLMSDKSALLRMREQEAAEEKAGFVGQRTR